MAKRSLNLVIGCGGSGLTTLSSLNRLLVQNPAMLPRLSDEVYYLAVDTEASALDQFEKEISEQMGQYPAPFMQRIQLSHNMNILNEMIRPNFIEPFAGQPNAKGLMRLREHWWFDGNGNPFVAPRVSNLIKGAGQCPPASYGLAWYHLDEIGDAIKRIVNRMVAHGYGDPTQLKNMNLVVVAGLSGGTGRGCWNLIAFKVREYLLSKYKVTVPPVGVFFDANVYENVAHNNEGQKLALKVNSLTGLSELSCWMMNGGKAGAECFRYSLPSIKSPERASTDVLKVNLDLNPTAGAPVNSAFLICGKSGSAILDNNRQFKIIQGPVFANIVLADEINRTPPKTQAALLEAMQERNVTVNGTSYPLPSPFFVLATQNPIEQEGTYPLPEAQLDRFMFNVRLDYPSFDEEVQIVKQTTVSQTAQVNHILSADEILAFQESIRRMPVPDNVVEYAVRLVSSTRNPENRYISWGAGPRASQ